MDLCKWLNSIGNDITTCEDRERCERIRNDAKEGIYPRCFYPEIGRKKLDYFDYIVIGLNPGGASNLEREFGKYIKNHKSSFGFEDIKIVMKPIIESNEYYNRVRKFLGKYPNRKREKKLNILWTELVKCQSELKKAGKKTTKFHLEANTKEKCFKTFLKKEIELFTEYEKPLLVLLGREVQSFIKNYGKQNFKKKKLQYLELCHPTGSWKFHSYFLHKNIENRLKSKIPKPKDF